MFAIVKKKYSHSAFSPHKSCSCWGLRTLLFPEYTKLLCKPAGKLYPGCLQQALFGLLPGNSTISVPKSKGKLMTNDREETWTQIYQITKEGFLFFLFFFSFLSPKFKSRKKYSLISLPHFLFQRSVEGARTSSAPAGSASRRSCDVMATTIVVTGATRPSAVCDRLRGFVRVGRDSSLWGTRGTGSALKTPQSQTLTPRWVASSLPLFASLKSANRFVPPEPPSWVCTWLTGPLS